MCGCLWFLTVLVVRRRLRCLSFSFSKQLRHDPLLPFVFADLTYLSLYHPRQKNRLRSVVTEVRQSDPLAIRPRSLNVFPYLVSFQLDLGLSDHRQYFLRRLRSEYRVRVVLVFLLDPRSRRPVCLRFQHR